MRAPARKRRAASPRAASSAAPRKKPRKGEETAQKAVISWAKWIPVPAAPDIEPGAKVSDYLFAIPNGGSRDVREAMNLKASGVKAGVWDLQLPIARHGFHGLWVEMKHGDNDLTDKQIEWRDRMLLAGWKMRVAWTAYEAERAIADYLGIKML